MKIYLGCPTGKRRDKIIAEHGKKFGACLTRDNFNHKTAKMDYFLDNGAFHDYLNNKPFDSQKFFNRLLDMEIKIRRGILEAPKFVVVPDIVMGGRKSLDKSLKWLEYLGEAFPHNRYYLAVQDDMPFHLVALALKSQLFEGLFVGGSKPFKYKHGEELVGMAKHYDVDIHCGGIGSRKAILWAKLTGFTSIDSSLAMIHTTHLNSVLNIEKELLWTA